MFPAGSGRFAIDRWLGLGVRFKPVNQHIEHAAHRIFLIFQALLQLGNTVISSTKLLLDLCQSEFDMCGFLFFRHGAKLPNTSRAKPIL